MAPLEKLIAKLPIYLKIRLDSWTVSSGRKPIKAYWTSGRLHIVGWLGLGKEIWIARLRKRLLCLDQFKKKICGKSVSGIKPF
jgi:hypothetical protein